MRSSGRHLCLNLAISHIGSFTKVEKLIGKDGRARLPPVNGRGVSDEATEMPQVYVHGYPVRSKSGDANIASDLLLPANSVTVRHALRGLFEGDGSICRMGDGDWFVGNAVLSVGNAIGIAVLC